MNVFGGDVEALAEAMFHREFESVGLTFPKTDFAIDSGTERGTVSVGEGFVIKDCAYRKGAQLFN